MANPVDRYPNNDKGIFYVDKNCISCGQCVETAPYNFKFTVGDKHAIVDEQPETKEEFKLCLKALESCPVDAIGAKNGKRTQKI